MVWEMFTDADLFLRSNVQGHGWSFALRSTLRCVVFLPRLLCTPDQYRSFDTELVSSGNVCQRCKEGPKAPKMKHKNNRSCTLVFILFYFIYCYDWSVLYIMIYYVIVLEFPAIIGSRILVFSSFVWFCNFQNQSLQRWILFFPRLAVKQQIKEQRKRPSKRLEDIGELRMDSPIVLTFKCENALEDVNWF